ncbi:hypothetical protein EYC98_14345 [Halieaceae bacterium IMCC14734]|uniref:FecR protein domain-containing protein n=1 Tax=Candidatus Litorirhabdus singularis TaxID=2518993 RepID=A0ABT3TJS3_9GAMM|nr:hypothetical protein [Candidatus Litorirhabdus singularis]MCX2982040.1 hypothetical protein [Candidatus Litorirhabdus singularis]
MNQCTSRTSFISWLALVLFLLAAPRTLYATSVLAVDMRQLVNEAAVIFEGEVIASEARWNAQRTSIFTHVSFRVIDVIKGSLRAETVTLTFAGGSVDDLTLQVDSMTYPIPGERGIYFLEDPARQQVNPLLGWSQGHFKITLDQKGRERVLTAGNSPVLAVEVDAEAKVGAAKQRSKEARGMSNDVPLSQGDALGLRLGRGPDDSEPGLDKASFKRALLGLLPADSRDGSSEETPVNPK